MAKGELIEPNPGNMRYVRRDDGGRLKELDDTRPSSAADQRREAHREALSAAEVGQWDKGDRKS